jgi:hypothetical protein
VLHRGIFVLSVDGVLSFFMSVIEKVRALIQRVSPILLLTGSVELRQFHHVPEEK